MALGVSIADALHRRSLRQERRPEAALASPSRGGWEQAAPPVFKLGGHQHALPHLVAALRAAGELEIMCDQQQAERLRLPQLFQEIDDVRFRILVEIAGRLVGEQQPRRVDQRAGNHRAPLLAA
jgi:hypothetical protein